MRLTQFSPNTEDRWMLVLSDAELFALRQCGYYETTVARMVNNQPLTATTTGPGDESLIRQTLGSIWIATNEVRVTLRDCYDRDLENRGNGAIAAQGQRPIAYPVGIDPGITRRPRGNRDRVDTQPPNTPVPQQPQPVAPEESWWPED